MGIRKLRRNRIRCTNLFVVPDLWVVAFAPTLYVILSGATARQPVT